MTTKYWSRDLVTTEINALRKQESDLRHSQATRNHPRLVSAAVRYFGSWGAAVKAAGINYDEIRKKSENARAAKVTKWSLESIASEIRKLAKARESLSAASVRENHQALFSAAVSPRYYGSWRNAITAVGLDYEEILAQTKASSTAAQDARASRNVMRRLLVLGEETRQMSDHEAHHRYPGLYDRANKCFGSWGKAVNAAFNRRDH